VETHYYSIWSDGRVWGPSRDGQKANTSGAQFSGKGQRERSKTISKRCCVSIRAQRAPQRSVSSSYVLNIRNEFKHPGDEQRHGVCFRQEDEESKSEENFPITIGAGGVGSGARRRRKIVYEAGRKPFKRNDIVFSI
jgi:hypothetical protein